MKKATKNFKNESSDIKTTKNYLLPSIAGLILILIILTLIIFFPNPSHEQYLVFRIVLAIACGGFAAIIPGFFKINYKHFIQASGALGVFALVYLINPAGSEAKSFDFTVFLETNRGETALKNKGMLILKLGNDKREEKIDAEGSVNFKNIPIANKNQTLSLQIEADGWQFENSNISTSILLKENNATVTIKRDNSLCCVFGSVRNESSEFLSDVKVSIGDVSTETNESGRFSLEIPPEKQKAEQKLTVYKEGYEIWEANVYPDTKQEVGIILRIR